MALSNRDRIGQMLDVLAPALDSFIGGILAPQTPDGENWTIFVQLKDQQNGITGKTYSPRDPQLQLRMLTENVTGQLKKGWFPFDGHLSQVQRSYASELRDTRNDWAHGVPFADDDAYRALDTAERLLKGIGHGPAADAVAKIRLNLKRVSVDKDDKRTIKAAVDTPESAGLRPWREVLPPHDDVATGNFQASEFAADLFKVATAAADTSRDYADPVEFFSRTYLTDGLRDLIGRAVRRLSGDDNASPVINLQTNFGGGKTHSMLSLWHVAAGLPVGDFPQDVQELLEANAYEGREVRRVAIVGNHLSTSGSPKPDGTHVNTIWGELAWQLGGAAAYEIVADADRHRTPPGEALHTLLRTYAPAVILIDEWVAYARTLVTRDDLPAGTFDDQFTFAQSLTEAVKGTSGVLLAISIPASETGTDANAAGNAAGNAEEVGGAHGLEALQRLQNVVRRVADQWRPASSDEAYHIVRRRLFQTPDAAALTAIRHTARSFVDFYRKNGEHFPRQARDQAYEERIYQTYPIHPELFDRLYEDWSALERFQRTRGVLRLMNTVIHALWVGDDASPMILPGSVPLATSAVNSELTQYLPDTWKPIIDADVDGPNSEPARIDKAKTAYGARSVTKRLARTVFVGAAPTVGAAQKGIETQRVFLGTAMPGDQPGNFHTALTLLGDSATYFYSGSGKYWYDLQANISRRAKDQAERQHPEDVWAEIALRLRGQGQHRGSFASVHVCPEETGDVPDTDEVKLVIAHPRLVHKKGDLASEAVKFAQRATEQRGSAHRVNRNMIAFLAPDTDRMAELDAAVRDYLGWKDVLDDLDLDLTQNQRNQATERRERADKTVEARLLQTYHWLLAPAGAPGHAFQIEVTKAEGQATWLAERVTKRMTNDGTLAVQQAGSTISPWLRGTLASMWEDGHVAVGDLWRVYAQYPYMPRLRDQSVLMEGVLAQPLLWEQEGFALATGYDADSKRYEGLALPGVDPDPVVGPSTLLVKPDVALRQRNTDIDARGSTGTGGPGVVTIPPDGPGPTVIVRPVAPGVVSVHALTRYFGSVELTGPTYAARFKEIFDEVLTHLAVDGTQLELRIDVSAVREDGFDETTVRTVRENAANLKFTASGFEES